MGVAVGSKLYAKFSSDMEVLQWLQSVFAQANLIYRPQLNFVLQIGNSYLQATPNNAPSWNQGNSCPQSINTQLDNFKRWDQPAQMGLWHLFDDCFPGSGSIGLASVGVLCRMSKSTWNNKYANTGLSWYSARTWKTFAHEVGHNFGGGHSFENGQGNTGGIMDYGDGTLDDIFQFNTQFRKDEMCAVMRQAVANQCSAITYYASSCGNGVVEAGEDCECASGTDCAYCSNCQLSAGKQCTPDSYSGAECCSSLGEYTRFGILQYPRGRQRFLHARNLHVHALCRVFFYWRLLRTPRRQRL